jgi:hypothetical protein
MSAFDPTAAFQPTSFTVDPPNRPDQMAEAVLASLSRGRFGYRGRPWGLVKTFVLSVLTIGILPLLVWPKRMRDFMVWEQQQFWHLAEWLRLRTGRPEATALRDDLTRDIGPAPMAGGFSLAFLVMAVVAIVHVASASYFDPGRLWVDVWNLDPAGRFFRFRRHADFFAVWTLALSAGYFVHWWQVCRHAGAVEAYVEEFNHFAAAEGIAPVEVRGVGVGFSPLWALAALIGVSRGALWAIPLALAGVVQMRYVLITSRRTRADLASRVRDILARARPVLDVRTTPRVPVTPCANDKCRAPVRPGAAFCTRCGSRVA